MSSTSAPSEGPVGGAAASTLGDGITGSAAGDGAPESTTPTGNSANASSVQTPHENLMQALFYDCEKFTEDATILVFVAAVNIIFAAAWIAECVIPLNSIIITAVTGVASGTAIASPQGLFGTSVISMFSACILVLIHGPGTLETADTLALFGLFLSFVFACMAVKSNVIHTGRSKYIVLLPMVAAIVYVVRALTNLDTKCALHLYPTKNLVKEANSTLSPSTFVPTTLMPSTHSPSKVITPSPFEIPTRSPSFSSSPTVQPNPTALPTISPSFDDRLGPSYSSTHSPTLSPQTYAPTPLAEQWCPQVGHNHLMCSRSRGPKDCLELGCFWCRGLKLEFLNETGVCVMFEQQCVERRVCAASGGRLEPEQTGAQCAFPVVVNGKTFTDCIPFDKASEPLTPPILSDKREEQSGWCMILWQPTLTCLKRELPYEYRASSPWGYCKHTSFLRDSKAKTRSPTLKEKQNGGKQVLLAKEITLKDKIQEMLMNYGGMAEDSSKDALLVLSVDTPTSKPSEPEVFLNSSEPILVRRVPVGVMWIMTGFYGLLVIAVICWDIYRLCRSWEQYKLIAKVSDSKNSLPAWWEAFKVFQSFQGFGGAALLVLFSTLLLFGEAVILVIITSKNGDLLDLASVGSSSAILVASAVGSNALFNSRSMFYRTLYIEGKLMDRFMTNKTKPPQTAEVDKLCVEELDKLDGVGSLSGLWTKWRDEGLLILVGQYTKAKKID